MSDSLRQQPLWGHLLELRKRLMIVFISYFVLSLSAYVFAEQIYQILVQPLAQTLEGDNRRLIYTGLAEAFLTYLKLAFTAGFVVCVPVILSQIWTFIAPGLYPKEKKALWPFFICSPVLFAVGVWLAYGYVIPLAWAFFTSFEQSVVGSSETLPIVLEARVGEYLSLTLTMMLAFGVAFQLPIVLGVLTRLGVLAVAQLRQWRKYALLLCLTVAAFLTPPDIISQLALGVPMYILYELSIVIAAVGARSSKA